MHDASRDSLVNFIECRNLSHFMTPSMSPEDAKSYAFDSATQSEGPICWEITVSMNDCISSIV